MRKIISLTLVSFAFQLSITAQIPTDNLSGAYSFDNNVLDQSGNNYHGTSYNITSSNNRNNIENKSNYFNGDNSYVILGSDFDFSSRSISLWFNFEDFTSDIGTIYTSDHPLLENSSSKFLIRNVNGIPMLEYQVGGGENIIISKEINNNKWYFIAMTVTSNFVNYYFNGELINTVPFINHHSSASLNNYSIVGSDRTTTGRFFKGSIDDIRIYNTALNPDQIIQLYNEGNSNCIPPPPNMISWWTGDEDSRDVIGSNNGVLNGASINPGMVDQALSFDGIDDYIEIPDTSDLDLSTGEFSIDFWVKPNQCSVQSSDAIPFITKESESQFDAYAIGIVTGEEFVFAESNDALSFQTVARGGKCISGEWHFLTITQSNNIAKLYVNGILVATDNSAVSPLNTSLPLYFGYRDDVSSISSNQTKYFDGQMDEIELFDRALSESEILDLYNAGSAGKCKTPIDNPIDEPTEDTIPECLCKDFCGKTNNKVQICHNGHTICVSPNAVDAHLDHGDYCGSCIIENNEENIQVYPNPTESLLTIVIDEDLLQENKNIDIKIVDLFGKTVKKINNIESYQSDLDISKLKKGMYILYVMSKKEILNTIRISKE